MVSAREPVPSGYHTITPALSIRGAERAIEFYKCAFGAEERCRMAAPDGRGIMHAELEIGDSRIFLGEECPDMGCRSPATLGGTTVSFHLYVPDVDAAFQRAVDAGARVVMPVTDMFWGDRYGKVADPFGHEWALATRVEDLTPEQISERAKSFFATAAAGQH